MRNPITKEKHGYGFYDTWEYCPVHGVYSDWDTELPEDMKKRRTESDA